MLDIPIEIDMACKLYPTLTKECYCYGNSNYIIRECLVRLDIYISIVKQQEELIKDLNVLKDIEIIE